MAFNRRSLIVTLVPVVFACELLLPEHADLHLGVGEALGCSGSANTAPPPIGFNWVKPRLAQDPDPGAVPIATDGFFTVDANGYMVSVEAALAGVQVVVKDEQGATVVGETKLLANDNGNHYLFGWSASSALAIGTKLQANVTATPVAQAAAPENVGGNFELVVVGEPTPLPTPTLTFSAWFDFFRGQPGPTVVCQTDTPLGGCSSATATSVPASVEKQMEAEVTWQPPAFTSGVAWQVRVEASPGQADADLSNLHPTSEYVGLASSSSRTLGLGRVVFPTPNQPYCVTIVLTDLRTKQEKRSEVCDVALPSRTADSDTRLGSCIQSPNPALTEAWCRLRPGSASFAECVALAGGNAGSGGGGGAGGGSTNGSGGFVHGFAASPPDDYIPAGAGSKPTGSGGSAASGGSTSRPASATNSADDQPRTSQGCQLGGSASSGFFGIGAASLSLLLLSLLARRRERSRP